MEQNSLQPTVSRWNRFRSSTGVVVACCFLMIFTSLGFCSSPKSFFLNVVAEELGVERTAFAINDTFRYVTTAILSVFFSAIFNKLGTKKMIVLGFGLLISSQCLYAVATNVLVFCIGGALLGAGLAMVSNTLASHIVKSRCTKNVGTIQGIVLAANGLGGAVATQLVDYFIRNHGYKSAYFMVAAVLLGVGVILVTLFMEDKSEAKMGPSKKKARGQVWEGISYNEGKRRGYFIPLCIMMFLTGCVLTGVNGIAKAHWEDVGITGVANIWSIHSLVLITGKFLTDDKGLGQAVGRGLHRIAQIHAVAAAVTQKGLETGGVGGGGDDENVLDAGQHQRGHRIVDHRFVVHRQQLLGGDESQRIQTGAGAAGQNDTFHQKSPLSL